jgi:hypothetical protein
MCLILLVSGNPALSAQQLQQPAPQRQQPARQQPAQPAENVRIPADQLDGYYFKVVKGQGPDAPLGQMDYIVDGATEE